MPEVRPFSAVGRSANLADLAEVDLDLLVIGGGITGAGVALQAVQRGYRVGLVEARDFASGTSSRSSKLVHGGIRYLAQGDVGLVHEALQERRRLIGLFPDLVSPLPFLMPIPRGLGKAATLAAGFWTYDALSIGSGFPRHKRIGLEEARRMAPALRRSDIRGAWKYWDAQTDDAALTVEVLRRAAAAGALVANYAAVTAASRSEAGWRVNVHDSISDAGLSIGCRWLVNASGVWAEQVEGLAGRQPKTHVRPSKGVHVSLAAETLPIEAALIFPVGDGRVLFAVPWHDHVIVGTTDNDYDGDIVAPGCSPAEEADVLAAVNRFFDLDLGPEAVLSRWAGVRPLVSTGRPGDRKVATKDISRKPQIQLDGEGLLTVTGGKLTTFWRMAEDALRLLPPPASSNGSHTPGSPGPLVPEEWDQDPLPGAAGYTVGDVRRACDEGMAMQLDDALSRRLRLSFLDVGAALSAAPEAARMMASRLGWSDITPHLERYRAHLAREFAGPVAEAVAKA
ncbi:MAG TPA: glycerol-3-phosphate dehydrogenase/oxidase [Candidatus Solibacter sp.]|jgi:glycerol-3-phosphate dehydrogenase|nr:glycerol-3-phosphate dehydrogenase/oxidase [Candidatus Solibacter sp.]